MTLLLSKTALRPVKYDNVTGSRFFYFDLVSQSAANRTKAILGLQLWTTMDDLIDAMCNNGLKC